MACCTLLSSVAKNQKDIDGELKGYGTNNHTCAKVSRATTHRVEQAQLRAAWALAGPGAKQGRDLTINAAKDTGISSQVTTVGISV